MVMTAPPTESTRAITTGGRAPRRGAPSAGGFWGSLPTMAVLVAALVYFALPVVWVLFAATKSNADLFGSFGLWFGESPQLFTNLGNLFTAERGIYVQWLVNSLIYSGVGALVATVLSGAAGYAFAKYTFFGREKLFAVILGGVLVPATVIALPTYFMFNAVGLTGTYWSFILPSIVSPFGVYLCRIYASAGVPDEVIEAARLDGAGDVRIFATIATRMMGPALVTVFLFQFVSIWNNYLLPLVMLNDSRTFPVTLGLMLWNGQTQRAPLYYELVVTGAAVSAVLLILVMAGLQRFWRAGLTAGSTKG
jgi:multiple sugar transport system permease protein